MMRHSFEQNIGDYNEIAKDLVEGDLTEDEERNLARELVSKIKRVVRQRDTDSESQMEIFEIQQEKQRIMQTLKERLARLSDPEFVPTQRPEESLVVKEGEQYMVKNQKGGVSSVVTKGEIITDQEWDMYYYLDPHTVPIQVRKRYLIEDAKRELMNRLNEQIAIDELASARTSDGIRDAYVKKAEHSEQQFGFVAERMVKSFLKKISYDYDLDFDIIEADIDLDIRQKIDFIIRRKKQERGVRVEENQAVRTGVQFTTNSAPEIIEHKTHQVEQANRYLQKDDPVKSIVLVSISSRSVRDVYNKWSNNPTPGGPDKLWDNSIKEEIFRGVMRGVLSEEEIDRDWSVIQGGSRK